MAEISLRHVAKRYGDVNAIVGLSLDVTSGEFFCLLGPPGMGKTTVLRLIAGLDRPDQGEIFLDGEPVSGVRPGQRDVAMVFEDLALYPHMSGFDNIAHPLRMRRVASAEIRRRVYDVADLLNIRHLLMRLPHTYSGGEQQRVAIARAIVREPKVLLLDQPLSNLDAKVREMMIAELRRLQRRTQQTTIYATHDYEEALALGDRILVLHDGQVDQIGAPDEIYLRPATTFVATITGTPPMNLIPCRIRDRRAIAGELAVAVTDAAGEATLGIRPEHARMGAGLPATVGLIQPVGRRKIVEVTVGGIRLKALGDAAFQAERGAPVGITLDPDRVCFYDQAGRLTPARAVGPFMLVGAED